MTEELEITVKSLVSTKEILKIMIDKGFYIKEEFILNDIYMVKQQEEISLKNKALLSDYVLIREINNEKVNLVIKNKEINNKGQIIKQSKTKCPIYNVEDGYNFMTNLGYKKLLEIYDHNILMSNDINEIYIQNVKKLGTYLEMEQKNSYLDNLNGNNLNEMIEILNNYNLPIDKSNYFAKKSYDMLEKIINE